MEPITIALLIAVFLSIVGVAGDFFLKLAGSGHSFMDIKWFILGFILYSSTAFGWFYLMKQIKLSTLGVFYTMSTLIFVTLISVFYFKENINIYEIIGIVTAIISVILLARFA
jgi:drug/metabolite transporter (DMT)-like permease